MNARGHIRIAGERTIYEWVEMRNRLASASDLEAWKKAYSDFFMERLKTRYFNPIDILNKSKSYDSERHQQWCGEGFAIVAIQCSLVEFLQATRKGLKYVLKNPDPCKFEYSRSKDMFIEFLSTCEPFKAIFSCKEEDHKLPCYCRARDFYEGVRCGLLHEARTKKGWTIRVMIGKENEPCIDFDKKVVYRNQLQDAFRKYVKAYGSELETNATLQKAFIRKFDDLCSE